MSFVFQAVRWFKWNNVFTSHHASYTALGLSLLLGNEDTYDPFTLVLACSLLIFVLASKRFGAQQLVSDS